MRYGFGLFALCFFGAIGTAPAFAKDEDPLQGTWMLESLEVEGQKVDLTEFKKFTGGDVHLIIAGTDAKFVVVDKDGKEVDLAGGGPKSGKFKLDASKSPKHIDLVGKKNDGKEEIAKAIYEVKGDSFKICFPKGESEERPTAFESSKEKKTSLMTFKKKK